MHYGASMQLVNVDPVAYFQALSDPIRVRIVRLLADSRAEACLCDLSESLQEPDYKISRHLKVLRVSGVLAAEKEGRWIYHRVVRSHPSLKHLFAAVQSLPDSNKTFAADLNRLKTRIGSRASDRCGSEPSESNKKKRVI